MKIIDTPWEQQNLGVSSSVKITVDASDDADQLNDVLENQTAEYIEIVFEGYNALLVQTAERNGFYFNETAMELSNAKTEVSVPKAWMRFVNCTTYERAVEQELQQIMQVIYDGNMFLTDKVALNPKFGNKVAGNRYRNWASSMLQGSAECYAIKYKDKLAGFEIVSQNEDEVEFCLGGGFHGIMGSGLMTVAASYNHWTSQEGIQRIHTVVSSNNLPVLKLHETAGLKVSGLRYVFSRKQKG